jgi:hypothetical protein
MKIKVKFKEKVYITPTNIIGCAAYMSGRKGSTKITKKGDNVYLGIFKFDKGALQAWCDRWNNLKQDGWIRLEDPQGKLLVEKK